MIYVLYHSKLQGRARGEVTYLFSISFVQEKFSDTIMPYLNGEELSSKPDVITVRTTEVLHYPRKSNVVGNIPFNISML